MRTIDIIGVMSDRILAKVKLVNKIPNTQNYWGVFKFKNQCESNFLDELSMGSPELPIIEIIDKTGNLYQVEFTMPFASPFNSSVTRYVLQQQTKYVPDMPNIRKRAIALSLDFAKIVVVGGLENSSYDRKSNVWIMENDVWTGQADMLNVRSFPTLQKLDSDTFLVIGGFSGSMPIERVDISTGNPVSEAMSAEGAFQSRPIYLPNCPALPYEITVLG
ncbi:Oidioi.mRNA.OKI2018_I69.chr2.g7585.t1.cds [Oikopleura dioica]|uniref:Oidioi.mRNA.OKI2018_I69.chr2.g7585.t1.cds n=1 Tax=Oikopleura dioica TaxID=34765 RepID=A0ABN7T6M8_OIKDI|nr:Oidioi.mRNA.OKI2018_I69.chr2.g7585.t1.cds [Oikopleura dioica]